MRHEDGSWSGLPTDKPLMGDPSPDESERWPDTLNPSELITALEIARLVLCGEGSLNLLEELSDQLDVTDEYLDLLGMRLERVLEGNHNGR